MRCTSATVSSSWPTPRWQSISHCSGMITSSAAVSALSVSTPSDGEQSSSTTSYAASTSSSARAQHVLPARSAHQLGLGAGQLDRGGQQVDAVLGRQDRHRRADPAEQHVVDAELDGLRVQPERERQAGLRVQVDQQHLVAALGQGGAERRDGGRLGDAALLVRYGDGPAHGAPLCLSLPPPCHGRPGSVPRVSTPPFLELPAGVQATSVRHAAGAAGRAACRAGGGDRRAGAAGARLHRLQGGLHRGPGAARGGRPRGAGDRPARAVRVAGDATTPRRTT